MSPLQQPGVLERLQAANPAAVDVDRGRSERAQAALQRILDDPVTTSATSSGERAVRRDRLPSRKGLAIVLAAMILGGGAALAASDPLGWWSPNPGEAKYAANPALHVRTPTLTQVSCRARSGGQFRCTAAGSGHLYTLADSVQRPINVTRARFTAGIAKALAAGEISRSQAARFRADLAAVPDSFFPKLSIASRFGTYGDAGELGNGRTLVPPPGVPAVLVCENAGAALTCQNLNGDNGAPVGAGVYMAEPTARWRSVPSSQQTGELPPGLSFTPAEYRVLGDLVRSATTSHSSSGSAHSPTAPRKPPPQPRRRTR